MVYKTIDGKQYCEINVNGKTGNRHIPLINSIPYIKEYLDYEHPMPTNPNAALISGFGKGYGKSISVTILDTIYRDYKNKYFPKLIESPNVSEEDRASITELMKKPWNPYIRRHIGLTDKSKFLKESILKQHAGWTSISNMPQVYLHYSGNESNESILEAYGLKTNSEEINKMQPKLCPNCGESNKIDSKFCHKCRMVLTYDSYQEVTQEKDTMKAELMKEMDKMLKMRLELHGVKLQEAYMKGLEHGLIPQQTKQKRLTKAERAKEMELLDQGIIPERVHNIGLEKERIDRYIAEHEKEIFGELAV